MPCPISHQLSMILLPKYLPKSPSCLHINHSFFFIYCSYLLSALFLHLLTSNFPYTSQNDIWHGNLIMLPAYLSFKLSLSPVTKFIKSLIMWSFSDPPAHFPPCSCSLGASAFPLFPPNLGSLPILLLLLCPFPSFYYLFLKWL